MYTFLHPESFLPADMTFLPLPISSILLFQKSRLASEGWKRKRQRKKQQQEAAQTL
jgi:hypothetical protein